MRHLILAALAALAVGAPVPDWSAAQFHTALRTSKALVAAFHVPWCAHCKKFEPEFTLMAAKLPRGVACGRVDGSKHPSLAGKYASAYPTVRVFLDGKADNSVLYTGERTAEALLAWLQVVTKAVGAAGTEAALLQFTAAAKKDGQHLAVGVFGPAHQQQQTSLVNVYDRIRGDFHVVVAAPEAVPKVTAPALFTINAQGVRATYEGDLIDERALAAFISNSAYPVFGEMKPGATFESYARRGLPLVWLFVDPKDSSKTEPAKTLMQALAKQHEGELSFVWIDGVTYAPMMKQLGVSQPLPALAIEDGNAHYAHVGPLRIADAKRFIENFRRRDLKRTIRSRPAPHPAEKNGLITAVGSTFASHVGNNADTLMLFYAPWCAHCQALMPVYKKVAEQFADEKDARVAAIDVTENDVPEHITIEGYPTILYFPADGSTPIEYQGDRTVKGIETFFQAKLDGDDAGDEEDDEDEEDL